MKIRKLLLTLVASSTLFAFGSQASSANASAWHKGIPSFITNHSTWIGKFRKNVYKGKLLGYYRTNLFFSKDSQSDNSTNGFGNSTYDKNKKPSGPGGNPIALISYPKYKKVGKNTYLIKGTKDVKFQLDFKFKVTKYSKKSIKVVTKGNSQGFHKWTSLGVLHPAN